MAIKEYPYFDATKIAELIKSGELSKKEVAKEAIERIEKINPKINAVITKTYDYANKANQQVTDKPLDGVPILLKDILQSLKGVRYTMGSKAMKNYIAGEDSDYVKRIKQTGAIILGKTNVPEFGLMGTTEPKAFGPTKNPWNLKHSSGGSSGGSAAAVASGMVPIACGNDGGGSIRIPSSCCGLVGLKPSRGRTPTGPVFGDVWMGLVAEHVITKSVRDSALLLDLTQGETVGAPYIIKPPAKPYIEEIKTPPEKLMIAFNLDSPLGDKINSEVRQTVEKTAKLLSDLGHIVVEDKPKLDYMQLAKSYVLLMCSETALDIEIASKLRGKEITKSEVEISTWILARLGKKIPAYEISKAKFVFDNASRVMGQFHSKYDIYLTPTLADLPAKLGKLTPSALENFLMNLLSSIGAEGIIHKAGILDQIAYKQLSKLPFTQLANQTGQPAISLPMGFATNGLPVGVQLMAAFGREDLLLKLSAQIEEAVGGFFKRLPDL